MASTPCHKKWNLQFVDGPRIALVVVRVSGENRVRVDACCLARGVNIRQHLRAPAVDRSTRKRRVMNRNDDRSGITFALDALKRSGEKGDLHIAQRIGASLA